MHYFLDDHVTSKNRFGRGEAEAKATHSLVRVVRDECDVRSRHGLGEFARLANVLANVLFSFDVVILHVDAYFRSFVRKEREGGAEYDMAQYIFRSLAPRR